MPEASVFIEAYACSEHGDGPGFAAFKLTESLVEELTTLSQLCADRGLSEVRVPRGCLWGPGNIQDELRLRSDELVVCGDYFWFRATPKHEDYHVESRAASIRKVLADAKDWKQDDKPLTYGEYPQDEWDDLLADELGEP